MTYDLYRSGFTQRYHGNAEMAWLGQTNAHHQWGVAVLMLRLFPERIRSVAVIHEALHHDVGEMGACDVSYPAKQKHPALAEAAADAEALERAEMGVPEVVLTEEETALLKFCDRLESYLFAAVRAPHVLACEDWQALRSWLLWRADDLDVAIQVQMMLTEARA